jgi:hypothetical protein
MKAEEFVLKIGQIAPSISDYQDRGFSEQYAMEVVNSYFINDRAEYSPFKDELLRLIDRFDLTHLKIGLVHFYKRMEPKADYHIVGEVEADLLVINKITGIVAVIDLFTEKERWLCAANGSRFLDAIFEVSNFIAKSSLDEDWKDDQKILCAISEEWGLIAGGPEFIEFYKMLIGCFE